jgi:hypothetical protein
MRRVVGQDAEKNAPVQITRGGYKGEDRSSILGPGGFRQAHCFAVHFLVREALANLPEVWFVAFARSNHELIAR